jgi:hypothetical protein
MFRWLFGSNPNVEPMPTYPKEVPYYEEAQNSARQKINSIVLELIEGPKDSLHNAIFTRLLMETTTFYGDINPELIPMLMTYLNTQFAEELANKYWSEPAVKNSVVTGYKD